MAFGMRFDAIYSARQVRDAADYLGSPFFSADAMRFFGSRLLDSGFHRLTADGYSGVFVTSERHPEDGRVYTVRLYTFTDADDAGRRRFDVDMHGDRHDTRTAALAAARAYADEHGTVNA